MIYPKVKLGEYINILSGFAFKTKDFTDIGVPIIKIKNVTPPAVTLSDLSYVTEEIAEKQKRYILEYNDVVIALTGSHINQMASVVGRIARVKHQEKTLLNQRVGKITSKDSNICNLDYIYYYLSQEKIKIELANKAGGAANQANISPTDVKNLIIPFPDVDTQKRIADILSNYDNLIDNNQKQIQLLEEAAQRLYKEWFIDLHFPGYESANITDGVPEGWRKTTIGEYLSVRSGFAFKSDWWQTEGYPVVKIKDINNNTIDISSLECVSPEKTKAIPEFKLSEGDAVIAMTGATIGKIGIVPNVENLYTNQRVGKIFPKDCIKNPTPFIFCFYSQKSVSEKIFALSSSSSAQPNISGKQLENLDVIANLEVVNLFCKQTISYFDKINCLREQISLLSQARDRLLSKLMSGEIEV